MDLAALVKFLGALIVMKVQTFASVASLDFTSVSLHQVASHVTKAVPLVLVQKKMIA
jgi:hypothetical protein